MDVTRNALPRLILRRCAFVSRFSCWGGVTTLAFSRSERLRCFGSTVVHSSAVLSGVCTLSADSSAFAVCRRADHLGCVVASVVLTVFGTLSDVSRMVSFCAIRGAVLSVIVSAFVAFGTLRADAGADAVFGLGRGCDVWLWRIVFSLESVSLEDCTLGAALIGSW